MSVYKYAWDIPHPFWVRLSFSDKDSCGHAACPIGADAYFSLACHRALCAKKAELILYSDDDGCKLSYAMEQEKSDLAEDVFRCTIKTEALAAHGGLFYFRFAAETAFGTVYTDGDFTSEYPLAADHPNGRAYQLLLFREEGVRRAPIAGGTMYQIMVDRFRRKNGTETEPLREDAELCEDWYADVSQYGAYPGAEVKNNLFYGGSLWGVIEKLDYLESLSVDTLYLCPVFEAYSNHKYDTGDYMRVDAMFGGDEALEALFRECEKRGMRVILDGVFNHTGADSRYFNRNGRYETVGAYQSVDSPYASWYDFTSFPEEYRCWWGVKILPAVNGNDPSFRRFIAGEGGVVERYMRMGAAGFRLDVVDEITEELLRDIRRRVTADREDGFLIGEVWEDASNKIAYGRRRRYFRGEELDSVMNYPMKNAVIRLVLKGDAEKFAEEATVLYRHYPKKIGQSLMNFLGTHDTERILTVLSGEDISGLSNGELEHYRLAPQSRKRAISRLMCAYSVLAFLPGVPCIYYGDEAGMEGGRDPFNRKAYPWGREDESLLAFFRAVGKVRREHRALFAEGEMRFLRAEGGILLAERYLEAAEKLGSAKDAKKNKEAEKTESNRPTSLFLAVNCTEEDHTLAVAGEYIRLLDCQKGKDTLCLSPGEAVWFAPVK